MQENIEIYPNGNLTSKYALVISLFIIFIVITFFIVKYLLKKKALKEQQELKKVNKVNLETMANDALAKIDKIKADLQNGNKNPKTAAEEVSSICRSTFDDIMNHRSMYKTKYENYYSQLKSIGDMQDTSYPLEFSENNQNVSEAIELCDKAMEIVKSCR